MTHTPNTDNALANRERWLETVGEQMIPHILAAAEQVTASPVDCGPWRVSCGWPSKGGLPGSKRRVRGQCWDAGCSGDAHAEIYISPVESDAREVADILAHELIHAVLGTAIGHKRPFPQIAAAIGLEGRPTSTHAGPAFWDWAGDIIAAAGEYPHAALSPSARGKVAKTYLLKAACPVCDYTVRITAKHAANGLPLCPVCSDYDNEGRHTPLELAE